MARRLPWFSRSKPDPAVPIPHLADVLLGRPTASRNPALIRRALADSTAGNENRFSYSRSGENGLAQVYSKPFSGGTFAELFRPSAEQESGFRPSAVYVDAERGRCRAALVGGQIELRIERRDGRTEAQVLPSRIAGDLSAFVKVDFGGTARADDQQTASELLDLGEVESVVVVDPYFGARVGPDAMAGLLTDPEHGAREGHESIHLPRWFEQNWQDKTSSGRLLPRLRQRTVERADGNESLPFEP